MGVESDGSSYSSAATARDRDQVRYEVLRWLGWSLVRIWSADWWHNSAGALDRLDAVLQERLQQSRNEAAREAEIASTAVHEAFTPAPDRVAAPADANPPNVEMAGDQLAPLLQAHRPDALAKKSRSTRSWPILACSFSISVSPTRALS